ncbi:MAG TPA: phospholipase D-like domain-containing protein [Tepidisphaeraceae bacterium]|jgi:cardiolipin synthase
MDLALQRKHSIEQSAPRAIAPALAIEGRAGTSPGINIEPGSQDDGWIVPPPVELGDGTRIQLYKDGEALHAAYEAIRQAKHRICLEVYIFASDATGRAFADLLCAKAAEGLKVYVIYDGFGSFESDPAMFQQMRRSGISVKKFHPIIPWECQFSWRPVNRDHRKLLVIDFDKAGMGGLNLGAEYGGSWVMRGQEHCEQWRDNAIGIVGPGSQLCLQAFKKSWRYVNTGGKIRRAEYIHNLHDGELGLLASAPTLNSPLARFLQQLVHDARRTIQLTMAYFAPSDELIDELCRACRRGVRVQLMVPGRCDVKVLLIAARSFYEKLMCAGIEVYERQGAVLHAKTMVIDGEISVIGSTNLDYRSIEYNCELSTLIRSKKFGRQMQALFENDIRYSKRVNLNQWRHRPFSDRFVQWAVSRARYWL